MTNEEEKKELPPVDFPTFIISLASSTQIHLGLLPDPTTQKVEKNLALARQTIDLLGLLEEKTKGNLTEDEAALLQRVLYDLRMVFMEVNK